MAQVNNMDHLLSGFISGTFTPKEKSNLCHYLTDARNKEMVLDWLQERTIRLWYVFLAVSLLQITSKGFAQNATINLRKDNISLEMLLTEIEKQTNVKFLYQYENVEDKKTNVHAENAHVSEVLTIALQPHGLKYTLMENNLIVVSPEVIDTNPEVILPDRYISGHVTDSEDGNPIPSVSVYIANSTAGTVTDLQGNYQLRIPGEGSYCLTVSHVGYQSVVHDIVPGRASVQFNTTMQVKQLEDLKVSAGIRFRQRDITLFWNKILGKKPSGRTIRALNSGAVYYFYNPETKLLKVTCREPLQIVNYETGYHIRYELHNFTHDYNTGITEWNYQYVFTELLPDNNRQYNSWGKKRKQVYDVSITKLFKSLFNNSLLNDGFVFTTIVQNPDPRISVQLSLLSQDSILSTNLVDNSRMLNLSNQQVMLFCFGKPVNDYDVEMLLRGKSNSLYANILLGDSIRIFPDGTYLNQLHMSPLHLSNSLLGLCMRLPIEYTPDISTSYK